MCLARSGQGIPQVVCSLLEIYLFLTHTIGTWILHMKLIIRRWVYSFSRVLKIEIHTPSPCVGFKLEADKVIISMVHARIDHDPTWILPVLVLTFSPPNVSKISGLRYYSFICCNWKCTHTCTWSRRSDRRTYLMSLRQCERTHEPEDFFF